MEQCLDELAHVLAEKHCNWLYYISSIDAYNHYVVERCSEELAHVSAEPIVIYTSNLLLPESRRLYVIRFYKIMLSSNAQSS